MMRLTSLAAFSVRTIPILDSPQMCVLTVILSEAKDAATAEILRSPRLPQNDIEIVSGHVIIVIGGEPANRRGFSRRYGLEPDAQARDDSIFPCMRCGFRSMG